ncbi:MAG: ABC transporter ATP-binding protein [Thermoprotei archaeon]|jgi:branched-chain amino acid transport system ATP-binding protein
MSGESSSRESVMMLRTEGVSKFFGGLAAVNNVSINVKRNSITLIIGPNGSGKTTLINIISGYYKPDNGHVFFEDQNITGWSPHNIYKIGLVRTFQIPQPLQRLTVLENLLVASRSPGEGFFVALVKSKWVNWEKASIDKAFKVLRFINLEDSWDLPTYELGGGQLKLLELGRALMTDVKMIMLDEPIAGVQPSFAHQIFSYIQSIRNELKKTFLIIEHRIDVALKYVDYVYAMDFGKIIAEGLPNDVVNDEKVIKSYIGE